MAGFTQLFKKENKDELSEQELMYRQNDRIFIFIMVLAAVVISVDYALVMKFFDIINNLWLGDFYEYSK